MVGECGCVVDRSHNKKNVSIRVRPGTSPSRTIMFSIELLGCDLIELVGSFAQMHIVDDGCPPRAMLGDSFQDNPVASGIRVSCGVGETKILWEGESLTLHTTVDTSTSLPVCSNNPRLSCYHETVTITGSTRETVLEFINASQRYLERQVPNRFRTLQWDAQCEHWRRQGSLRRRPWDSIVMDETTEATLVGEMDEFFSEETQSWYENHGIPYRRGFLFYGPPGTGKTSCVSALASRFGCNVYRLNLVAKGLTDDSLQLAITCIKERAIVVVEDVDCLFDKHREKTDQNAVITFSGLLNAMDGIQTTERGTVFIFTTNFRDRLDSALRRKGRIDMELSFDVCSTTQVKRMFQRFYPSSSDEQLDTFAQHVRRSRSSTMPTPAELQEFFVRNRKTPSEVACCNVSFDATTSRCLEMWT